MDRYREALLGLEPPLDRGLRRPPRIAGWAQPFPCGPGCRSFGTLDLNPRGLRELIDGVWGYKPGRQGVCKVEVQSCQGVRLIEVQGVRLRGGSFRVKPLD